MDAISLSGFWPGFSVVAQDETVPGTLQLHLIPDADPLCSRCGRVCPWVHDRRYRELRDRDLLDRRVWLRVLIRRMVCPDCGCSTERIAWADPCAQVTRRLAAWIEALLDVLPIAHIAKLSGLHWHTIKQIDRRRLQRSVGTIDAGNVRRLVMDEFALYKGHRYATVVMDAERTRVLWVGQGNSREAIRPFFQWLGDKCQQIEAVAMDMNTAFDLEVRAHCPNAEVVYDLFHVIARYGREVIDRIRVDQANALRQDRPARKVIKQSRWLLLRNPENLKPEQSIQLDELLSANQPLATCYILKFALKDIWYAPSVLQAARRWRQWQRQARQSGLAPLEAFARRLKKYARGILATARFPMHTSLLEGVNNRIKVIKRMAYGFRDADYFFLKIKAAFPGKPR